MKIKSAMRTVLYTCAALAFNPAAHATLIADFATDFSGTANPSGPWTYGFVTAPGGTLTLSTDVTSYGAGNEVVAWSPTGTFWPTVGLNTSSSPVSFGAGNAITVAGLQGLLHPGPSGDLADVRYTAPGSFTALLSVAFSGVDATGTTTDVHVLLNNVSIFSAIISSFGQTQSFQQTLTLAAGDVLDFAVGRGANNSYVDDSTGFYASLSTADAPEPATVLLLLGGLAVAGHTRRRLGR